LRDRYGTADFTKWPETERGIYSASPPEKFALSDHGMRIENTALKRNKFRAPSAAEDDSGPGFYFFVQFHLHLQLKEASEHAHASGVILKGDIPIGVGRGSADAWQQPELFRLEVQAGAPPDAFAVKGQNWGFPTYNWPRMKETGFAWWKQRFEQMGCYFDAFRIDHILGFFRIWSIPAGAVEGILGYFVPALPVRVEEFAARGIQFDRDRFVKPWITDQILSDLFGPEKETAKNRFLQAGPTSAAYKTLSQVRQSFVLRSEFTNQRAVQRYFAEREQNEQNLRLMHGLFDLISNVLLFEAPGSQGTEFHFRFNIESTSSFRDLDAQTQAQLRDLYVDYLFRRQDGFWMKEALEKLPALKRATNMLICGEDLGLVPACVPDVMKQLGLLSLEIQRMPKEQGREFFHPKDAPYLSVVTPSSHDMSTIRGWWKEDRGVTQRFYNQELGLAGEAPGTCEPWINRAIVELHLSSPAMWSIFQLQDLLGMDEQLRRANPAEERINVPANPRNYWRYRMRVTLEALMQARDFTGTLKHLIQVAGR